MKTLGLGYDAKTSKSITNKKYYEKKKEDQEFQINNEDELKEWCARHQISLDNARNLPNQPFIIQNIINNNFYCISDLNFKSKLQYKIFMLYDILLKP